MDKKELEVKILNQDINQEINKIFDTAFYLEKHLPLIEDASKSLKISLYLKVLYKIYDYFIFNFKIERRLKS